MLQASSIRFFALLFILSVPESAGTNVTHDNVTELSRLDSTGRATDPQPISWDNHNNRAGMFDFGTSSSKESDKVTTTPRGLRMLRTDRDLKGQNGPQSVKTTKKQPNRFNAPQAPKKSKGPKGGLSKKSKGPKGIPKKSKGPKGLQQSKVPKKVKSVAPKQSKAPINAIKGKAKMMPAPKQSKAPIMIKGKAKTTTTADETSAKETKSKDAKRILRTRTNNHSQTKKQTLEASHSNNRRTRQHSGGGGAALEGHAKGAKGGAAKTVKRSFTVPAKASKVPQAAVLPKQSKGPKGDLKSSKAPAKPGKKQSK